MRIAVITLFAFLGLAAPAGRAQGLQDLDDASSPVPVEILFEAPVEMVLNLPARVDPSNFTPAPHWAAWSATASGGYVVQASSAAIEVLVYEEEPDGVQPEFDFWRCRLAYWPSPTIFFSEDEACRPRARWAGKMFRLHRPSAYPNLRIPITSSSNAPPRLSFPATAGLSYLIEARIWNPMEPRAGLVTVVAEEESGTSGWPGENLHATHLPAQQHLFVPPFGQPAESARWTAATSGVVEVTLAATSPCTVALRAAHGQRLAHLDNQPREEGETFLPGNLWARLSVEAGQVLHVEAVGTGPWPGRALLTWRETTAAPPTAARDQAEILTGPEPTTDVAFAGAGWHGRPNPPQWSAWTAPREGVYLFKLTGFPLGRVRVFAEGEDEPLADSLPIQGAANFVIFPGMNRAAVSLAAGQVVHIETSCLNAEGATGQLSIRPLREPRWEQVRLTNLLGLPGSPRTFGLQGEVVLDPEWFYVVETSSDLVHWEPQRVAGQSLILSAASTHTSNPLEQPPWLAVTPPDTGRFWQTLRPPALGSNVKFLRFRPFLERGGPRSENFLHVFWP